MITTPKVTCAVWANGPSAVDSSFVKRTRCPAMTILPFSTGLNSWCCCLFLPSLPSSQCQATACLVDLFPPPCQFTVALLWQVAFRAGDINLPSRTLWAVLSLHASSTTEHQPSCSNHWREPETQQVTPDRHPPVLCDCAKHTLAHFPAVSC